MSAAHDIRWETSSDPYKKLCMMGPKRRWQVQAEDETGQGSRCWGVRLFRAGEGHWASSYKVHGNHGIRGRTRIWIACNKQ